MKNSIHNFKIGSLEGGEINFADFSGKKILLVNVASECGYTPQYAQLQEANELFAGHLAIVGFPCNDFGGQEPGSALEIMDFCTKRYGVTFPLTEKVKILGNDPHPVYKFLTRKSENGFQDSEVTWNFQKFLLDENGFLEAVFPPSFEVFNLAF